MVGCRSGWLSWVECSGEGAESGEEPDTKIWFQFPIDSLGILRDSLGSFGVLELLVIPWRGGSGWLGQWGEVDKPQHVTIDNWRRSPHSGFRLPHSAFRHLTTFFSIRSAFRFNPVLIQIGSCNPISVTFSIQSILMESLFSN